MLVTVGLMICRGLKMQSKPDLAKILEHYGVNVQDRYGWIPCKCVIHDDTHASAAYNLDLQLYNCLVCQILGDSIEIVKHKEGLDFKNAKRKAESIAHGSSKKIRPRHNTTGSVLPINTRNNSGSSKYIPSWKRRGA